MVDIRPIIFVKATSNGNSEVVSVNENAILRAYIAISRMRMCDVHVRERAHARYIILY